MSIDSINANNSTSYKTSKATYSGNVSQKNFSDALNSAMKTNNLDQIFESASNKYGVPVNLLKSVAKAESNFNTNAQSSAGAQGIMQLMPSTAKSLGVTDSFDAKQNIMGGAKLLGQLLDKYDGNTELALAAYNAGSGNVAKYGGIPPFKETQNYVKKVMGYCGNNITIDSSKSRLSSKVNLGINQTSNINSYNKSNIENTNLTLNAATLEDMQQLLDSDLSSNFFNDSNNQFEKVLLMNILQNELQKRSIINLDMDNEV